MPAALFFFSWCIASVRQAGVVFYQFVVFLPVVVSAVATASDRPDAAVDPQFGVVNTILRSWGLPGSLWVQGSSTALPVLVVVEDASKLPGLSHRPPVYGHAIGA